MMGWLTWHRPLFVHGRTAIRYYFGMTSPHFYCHPMFAHLSSKGKTARSFGGRRMTKMGGRPHGDRPLSRTVILCLHTSLQKAKTARSLGGLRMNNDGGVTLTVTGPSHGLSSRGLRGTLYSAAPFLMQQDETGTCPIAHFNILRMAFSNSAPCRSASCSTPFRSIKNVAGM
jgi:hypothetical protein